MQIPKIIHQIWVGNKEFPKQDLKWSWSLKNTNPDWHFILHAEHPDNMPENGPWDEIKPLPHLMLQHIANSLKERMSPKRLPAAIADIVRVESLINYGGVYFDTDVVGVKPIDDVLEHVTLALSWEYSQGQIGNFFVASKPQHPALYQVLNKIHETTIGAIGMCHDLNPFWITGPKVVEKILPSYPDYFAFPFRVMSPWNPSLPFPDDYESLPIPECTRVIHLFDSKWTTLERDPSLPKESGFDFHIHDSHCRDCDGDWKPIQDGHYAWPAHLKDGRDAQMTIPIDYSRFYEVM